jgi:hypothetical protein
MTRATMVRVLVALLMAASVPSTGADEGGPLLEPLPIRITEVTPAFRACSIGPEFRVKFRNMGNVPISVGTVANAVIVEAGGVRYGQGAVFAHGHPSHIAAGADWVEPVVVGLFGVPLAEGENVVTIWIAGVRSSPIRFTWSPPSADASQDDCRARRLDVGTR